MKVSDYEGAVDLWKARLVIGMCKGFGFRGADLDDAVQDMMIIVLGFRYDAAKANGRNERAALSGLLRRKLANLYRAERNRRKRFGNVADIEETVGRTLFWPPAEPQRTSKLDLLKSSLCRRWPG